MTSYRLIDSIIEDWRKKHSLKIHTSVGDREVRSVYVSSIAGECFQIWINPPTGGRIDVFAACVEGRREDDVPHEWRGILADDLRETLELVFNTIIGWMAPATRNCSHAE